MPADVIDYRLIGDDLQAVIITLDPGEAAVAEAGSMMYMEDDIQMATTLDATGQGGSLWGKLLQGGKRLLTGDSFFVTMFANNGRQRRDVAFASPYPGKILPVDLKPGQTLRVDTGCIVAMQPSVDYDIRMVPGIKTALFGGEGLFFAHLSGPGRVILQTLPFSRLADRIIAASRVGMGGRREEGSILGGLGGLLDGDN
ncbi:MAG: AIM24 family protein [Gemmatimonadota bacterium]